MIWTGQKSLEENRICFSSFFLTVKTYNLKKFSQNFDSILLKAFMIFSLILRSTLNLFRKWEIWKLLSMKKSHFWSSSKFLILTLMKDGLQRLDFGVWSFDLWLSRPKKVQILSEKYQKYQFSSVFFCPFLRENGQTLKKIVGNSVSYFYK